MLCCKRVNLHERWRRSNLTTERSLEHLWTHVFAFGVIFADAFGLYEILQYLLCRFWSLLWLFSTVGQTPMFLHLYSSFSTETIFRFVSVYCINVRQISLENSKMDFCAIGVCSQTSCLCRVCALKLFTRKTCGNQKHQKNICTTTSLRKNAEVCAVSSLVNLRISQMTEFLASPIHTEGDNGKQF